MTKRLAWTSVALVALSLATACGGDEGDDDDDGGAGASGEAGTGGSGAARGGSGGSAQGGKGSGGSANGGSAGRGGSGGSDAGEGGNADNGGSAGSRAGSGGAAGTVGVSGSAGSGGASGSGGAPVTVEPGFTEGVPLAEGVSALEDPKLVMNQAGEAVVAWVGYADGHQGIWTIRYDPTVGSWGEPEELQTDERYDAELDDLALDEAGNAYVVWTQGHIFVTRYAAESREWADAEQIEDHDEGSVDYPRIATGPEGTASLVWMESDGSRASIRNRRYDPETGEWSFWEPIDDADRFDSNQCVIAVDAGGNAVAVWVQRDDPGVVGNSVLTNEFDAEAGTWGEPVVLVPENGTIAHVSPVLTADPDGNFFLVWQQAPIDLLGDFQVWAIRRTASGWDDAVALEDQETFASTEAHIAVNASGNAMVVWTADDHMWNAHYDADADGWSDPVRADDTAGWIAKWADIAMDAEGNAMSAHLAIQPAVSSARTGSLHPSASAS